MIETIELLEVAKLALTKIEKRLMTIQPDGKRSCTCIDCLNWDSKDQICGIYNCVPPPIVIAGIGYCEQRCLDLPF